MKKLFLAIAAVLVISACSNKDIYFNGSEGSHSGIRYDHRSDSIGVNK